MEYSRRQLRSLFGYPPLCPYTRRSEPHGLKSGYLLIDYIEEEDGVMLSKSWEEKRHDKSRTTNLFRDLSRIILCLHVIDHPAEGLACRTSAEVI